VTPMFFGSAFNNFGVDLFLQSFIDMAVAPGPAVAKGNPAVLQPLTAEQLMERRQQAEAATTSSSSSSGSSSSSKKGAGGKGGSTGSSSIEGTVQPESQHFSGLVFKLQANMDPKHRDKVCVWWGGGAAASWILGSSSSSSGSSISSSSCRWWGSKPWGRRLGWGLKPGAGEAYGHTTNDE